MPIFSYYRFETTGNLSRVAPNQQPCDLPDADLFILVQGSR